MARRLALLAAAALLTLAGLGPPPGRLAGQEAATTLRIATLAPRGSSWLRVYQAWGNSVREKTGGALALRFTPGGAVDEVGALRALRGGRVEGATLTSAGLGEVAPATLVLQLPGVVTDYAQLDRARAALDRELTGALESAGFQLLHWVDLGKVRWLSKDPVARPEDLRGARPAVFGDDVIGTALLAAAPAEAARVTTGEAFAALRDGRVGAVRASAIAAVNLQWFSHLGYVTAEPHAIVVGATVLRRDRFEALPEDQRRALLETAAQAGELLRQQLRREDERSFALLRERGLTAVDTTPHRQAWAALHRRTRDRLVGRAFPRPLVERLERAARAD